MGSAKLRTHKGRERVVAASAEIMSGDLCGNGHRHVSTPPKAPLQKAVTQRSGPEPEEAEARGSAQQPQGIDKGKTVGLPEGCARGAQSN